MDKLKSEGKCLYCNETVSKLYINRHLQKHLADKTLINKPGRSFLLKVQTNPDWGNTPYFLSLWIDGQILMDEFDQFLRDIWLECCGHMSSFTNPKNRGRGAGMFDFEEAHEMFDKGQIKEYEKIMEEINGEVPMSRKAELALYRGLKLVYRYDFGSTTELELSILDEYPVKADKAIVLLSRNEPPELLCEHCDKEAAKEICMVCFGSQDEGIFCVKCAKKHAKTCDDYADYAAMPVVNSPRMGVCGYGGGRIDVKRDGIFKKAQRF
ncbi:MAG: hypothetical protein WKF68_08055 [Daejeonella sp.]